MTLKFNSFDSIIELYLKKHYAKEKNDIQTLEALRKNHPELFDTKFLLDLLKEAFIRMGLADKGRLH